MLRAVQNQAPGFKYLGEMAWASVPAASGFSGWLVVASDIGANGTLLRSNGTRWLAVNGSSVLKGLGATVSGVTNAGSNILQTLLPVGGWQVNDSLRFWLNETKSGGTDTLVASVYIGTAGTTADALVWQASLLSAATIAGQHVFDVKLIDNTNAQKVGHSASGYSGSGTGAHPSAVTIPGAATNALYVTLNIASSGTTNTVGATSGQIQLITP